MMYNVHRLRNLIQKEMELAMDPAFKKSFFNKSIFQSTAYLLIFRKIIKKHSNVLFLNERF